MATVIKKRKDGKKLDEFISTSERITETLWNNHIVVAVIGTVAVLSILAFIYVGNLEKKKRGLLSEKIFAIEQKAPQGNQKTLTGELEKLVEEFANTDGINYAEFLLARQYSMVGEPEKAMQILMGIKTKYPSSFFSELAGLELGLHLENTGKCGEAIAQFSSLIDGVANYLKAEAYIGMGRCQEEAGNKEEALESYKKFIEKFPGYGGYEFANMRIKALSSQ